MHRSRLAATRFGSVCYQREWHVKGHEAKKNLVLSKELSRGQCGRRMVRTGWNGERAGRRMEGRKMRSDLLIQGLVKSFVNLFLFCRFLSVWLKDDFLSLLGTGMLKWGNAPE